MSRFLALVAFLAASVASQAQVITTVAGGGAGDGGPAVEAALLGPKQLAIDATGNVFIADSGSDRVRRVDAVTGVITTVVGKGYRGFTADGLVATQTAVWSPRGVALDGAGNLWFAESNYLVRKVDAATSIVTTIAGVHPQWGYAGDGGPANQAWLTFPEHIVRDGAGNIFIADSTNQRVRRVDAATGIITTIAGGAAGGDGGPATNASLNKPVALALDAAGDLYIAEFDGSRVRKVTLSTGVISTVAGNGVSVHSGDGGLATAASLENPAGLVFDASGHLYISDSANGRVRRVDAATGIITTFAGGGLGGDGGPATDAILGAPTGLAFDGAGRLYIADALHNRVRRIENGIIGPFAGVGPAFVGDGYPATNARLAYPHSIAFDAAGHLYIADPEQRRVRRVDAATGVITTFAGTGAAGSSGDGGPAVAAAITPTSVAVGPSGDVFIGDVVSNVVRKVAAGTGIIAPFAGNGTTIFAEGVPATLTGIAPHSLAVDASGNVYIGDGTADKAVRLVAAGTATITTVAAPGPARALALDGAGNLYVGSAGGVQGGVFKVAAGSGTVSAVPGIVTGVLGLAADPAGNLFYWNSEARVYRWSVADGSVAPVAGTGNPLAELGDGGHPLAASVHYLHEGLAFRPGDGLYLADSGNHRVRKVTFASIEASPVALAFDGRLPQTTSLPRRLTLTNTTASPIAIASITTSGAFAATHDCGASIAAAGSCNVDVTFTPPAVGPYSAPLAIDASTGAQSVTLSGVGELSLVTHYYETIMRRPPDSIGKTFWENEKARMGFLGANVNETWFALSSYFYTSPEYLAFDRPPADFVTDLYRTFFNRAPDAPGLQFWVDQMANGMPREVVLASFQHSPEFATFTQGLFGNTAARPEIDMIMDFYRGLLGRLPDTNGFLNWRSQVQYAQCNEPSQLTPTVESISDQFANSVEYLGKNRSNAQFVGDLYNAYLRRGGDLTGVLVWINALQDGNFTRDEVREQFMASSEFGARIGAVAAAGCAP